MCRNVCGDHSMIPAAYVAIEPPVGIDNFFIFLFFSLFSLIFTLDPLKFQGSILIVFSSRFGPCFLLLFILYNIIY